MKKIISVLLTVVLVFGMAVSAFAIDVKEPLRFGDDGRFSIMHVTDTHLDSSNVEASTWLIAQALDRENPDLVVITGDNVYNDDDAEITKGYITKLMTPFEERNIPVAVTFGNHDSERGAMTREELMAFYNTFSCSVSVDDGPLLSGCGTYNLPVFSSNGTRIKFNVWVFDSNDYIEDGGYAHVKKDQIEWYKATSDALRLLNGGEKVNSIAFQHIIVPEIYDALKKTDIKVPFSFEHINNEGEYYMFNPDNVNYGTLNEMPCPGRINEGQFEAMVEKGDVLAIHTGHDHTNGFGVKYQGIDICTSLSTRYNGDAFSTQYGYRMIVIDENDTTKYETKVVHWYDMITLENFGEFNGHKTAFSVAFNGFFQSIFQNLWREVVSMFTGRTVTYPDMY